MGIRDRLIHAWNAFKDNDPFKAPLRSTGGGSYYATSLRQPYRYLSQGVADRSIATSIMTRMAIDVSSIEFIHARLDENRRFTEEIDSGLDNCLNVQANCDQAARMFKQDLAMTMFTQGVAAVVPVDTTLNPDVTGGYDVMSLRVGTITSWFPREVRVSVYNDQKGIREEILMKKENVAIIENPFYEVMNQPNSMFQRLTRKLNLLDSVDDDMASKKLDMIIQLPYVVKSESRREQAQQRAKDIEFQLKTNELGIAYIDGTERITQLNRPLENNLLPTVEWMSKQVYSQLGITVEIMEGTASEDVMLNYYKRTIEPIADSIAEELACKFLTKTARTQKQSIIYLRRPFDLVPMQQLAEIADKFTRNEILTSNEIRTMVGFKPASDKGADALRNSNMPVKDTLQDPVALSPPPEDEE